MELLRYWCGYEVHNSKSHFRVRQKMRNFTEINGKRKDKVKRQKINTHLGM